jgi:tetratricopeptide (TPR) repeat protein
LVVGCYRDTETGPELADAVAGLAREPRVERVALAGLSAPDVARLLEAVTGEAVSGEVADRVHEQTQGNPLFAGELARLLTVDAQVGDALMPIPDGVRDAIRQRLQGQSPSCRELLSLASVLGREFNLATIAQLCGLKDDDLSAALEEAGAARLIINVPGAPDRFRFSHILVRDALYEDLPAPRRLRLHLAAGEAIETLCATNPRPHVAEMTLHFVAAGRQGSGKAATYAEQAADAAAAQHGYEEAARFYTLALELLHDHGPADLARECELLLSLGEMQSRAGDAASAKEAYRLAASIAEEHGWHNRLVRAALAYGGRFAWVRASTDPALVPLLERALEVAETDDARSRVRLLARLAAAVRDDPVVERRRAFADEAVKVARASGDPVALAYALEGYGVASEGIDPAHVDLPTADELIAVAAKLGDRERAFSGHDFRLNAIWKLGDRAGVEVEIERLAQVAEDLHQPAQQWSVSTERTMFALMEGRFADAEALIAQTRAAGERAESWNAVVSERVQLFVLRRAQGRLAELEDVLARSVHEYPTLLRFRCALAHLYTELGDAAAAREPLHDVLAHDLGREYLDAEWLFTMSLLPDVLRSLDDTAAAEGLYEVMLPRERLYAHAPIEATFGSVARSLGVLATTGRRYDDAERHLRLAIETERRMGARPWLAHAQHDLAAALRMRDRPGDSDSAADLIAAAVTGYEALGMSSWAERARRLRRR